MVAVGTGVLDGTTSVGVGMEVGVVVGGAEVNVAVLVGDWKMDPHPVASAIMRINNPNCFITISSYPN
jgi:transketolase N-terminal domain/subunit